MFKYDHVCIESFGYELPREEVTSAEIERQLKPVYERFGLHEGRLELMTGIRRRRFWPEGMRPSEGSARAARRAIETAGVDPEQIECLIHGSVSRDFLEPATAAIVHDRLGLSSKSILFDISNACLGFVNGILSLANMIELRQVKRGLIVACESSRQLVRTTIDHLLRSPLLTRQEMKAAFASLTIGSGAVAMVMTHDSVSAQDHRLLGGASRTATNQRDLCRGSDDTGFHSDAAMLMETDSESLLNQGCELAAETWTDLKRTLNWTEKDLDRCYCHQVGAAHRDRLYESLQLDVKKDFATFETLGNVGSVSLPLTAAMGVERHPPRSGERIGMFGIGSGLSCVMLGIRW